MLEADNPGTWQPYIPTPQHLDSLCVPILRNLSIFKKIANARGVSRGGMGTAGID